MKRILIGTCLLTIMFLAATPRTFADTSSSQDGARVTLTVMHVPEVTKDFTYDVSPNVDLHITASGLHCCISSTNVKTDQQTGLDFTTISTATGYAQRAKANAAGSGVGACDSPTQIPAGSTWHWLGGSGS